MLQHPSAPAQSSDDAGRTTPRTSLNALRAFEAAARLGSMTAAGAELGVTHGAVSRQVQLLEEQIGTPLLRRLPKSVEATAEGERLLAPLSAAFKLINAALAQLRPGPLTVSCSATIMQNWLIPRLADLQQRHPDIELRLNVSYREVDPLRDEVSVAIRNDMIAAPPDVILQPLVPEDIGLVCTPALAAQHAIRSAEDLAALPLLATRTRPSIWTDWAAAIGHAGTLAPPAHVFEHFYLMIQAASYGLGAAIAPRMTVEGEIAAGRLVAPCGFVPGPHHMVLWLAPHLRGRSDLRRLVAWIREQAAPLASTPPRGGEHEDPALAGAGSGRLRGDSD